MKIFLFSFTFLFITISCCSNKQSLEDYALELSVACQPGKFTKDFVSASKKLSPDKRLAIYYKYLNKTWVYEADGEGNDHIQSAEIMIKMKNFRGDCDDMCSVLMAICRAINVDAYVCLGTSKSDPTRGHAWVEVLICRREKMISPIRKRLTNEFGKTSSIVLRGDRYWLRLVPKGALSDYELTYIIDKFGNLKKTFDGQ